MTEAAAVAATSEQIPAPGEAWVARQLCALEELAEIGMELVRDLRDQVRAAGAPRQDPQAPAKAYSAYARAIRLTLALEAKFRQDQAARARDPDRLAAQDRARRAAERAAQPPAERRREVLRTVVPEMIRNEFQDEERADELCDDCETLVDREIGDADILNRPIPELIAAICEALDIEPDWSCWDPAHWTHEDWGLTDAEIAAGSPAAEPRPRIVFPPLEDDAEAAERTAERLAVQAPP